MRTVMDDARDAMFSDPRISGPVIPAPAAPVLTNELADAMQHVQWADADLSRDDVRTALFNIVAANRMHAMSREHATTAWEYVAGQLRRVQRELWDLVRR